MGQTLQTQSEPRTLEVIWDYSASFCLLQKIQGKLDINTVFLYILWINIFKTKRKQRLMEMSYNYQNMDVPPGILKDCGRIILK